MKNYKTGSIISIRLENFQTFESQELQFGPELNLIAAPNGTGKSTIANAIAFVFNGGPKTIGKSKDTIDFIRFGKDKAIITACVAYNDTEIFMTRELQAIGKKNIFYINGKLVSHKVYMGKVDEMGIDVNNLCIFLPQERVSEFAKMSGPELLLETLEHSGFSLERLYSIQQEIKEVEQRIESTGKQKVMVEKSIVMMSSNMKDIEETEKDIERLKRLEYKKAFIEYEMMKIKYLEMKRECSDLTHSISVRNERLEDIQLRIEEIKSNSALIEYNEAVETVLSQNRDIKEVYKEAAGISRSIENKETEISRLYHKEEERREALIVKQKDKKARDLFIKEEKEKFYKNLQELKSKILAFDKAEKNRIKNEGSKIDENSNVKNVFDKSESIYKDMADKDLNSMSNINDKDLMDSFVNNKGEIPNDESLINAINSNSVQEALKMIQQFIPPQNLYDKPIQKCQNLIRQIQFKSGQLKEKIDELEQQKVNHQNQNTRRLEQLKKYHLDTWKAVEWLRTNKNEFIDEIIEPAFLHISINPDYVSEVESVLNFQALSSFLVKNHSDFVKLTKILKDQMRLSINVAEITKDSTGHNEQNLQALSYRESPQKTKEFNNQNLITVEVLQKYSLDGVITDFIQGRNEYLDFFNLYYHLNLIPVSKSNVNEIEIFRNLRHVKKIIAAGRYLEFRKSRYGDDYVIISNKIFQKRLFETQKVEIDNINNMLEEYYKEREINKKSLAILLENKQELDSKKTKLKLQFDVSELLRISYSIENEIKNLVFIENELTNLENLEYNKEIEKKKNEQLEAQEAFRALYKSLSAHLDLKKFPQIDIDRVKTLILDIDNEKRQLILENSYKEREEAALKEKTEQKITQKKELSACTEHIKAMGRHENLDELPSELIEIQEEIKFYSAKIQIAKGKENIKKEYENKENTLSSLNKEHQTQAEHKQQLISDFQREKVELTQYLKQFLAPVNQKLSELFAKFGYSGIIEVDTDSEEWALNIMVKFRDAEGMQRLSAYRQSGGEKSLSTILFLLSLQQSRQAPFRLVDEINQGMDAHNERIVYKILKEMSDSSQFFIITPKLIEDIDLGENTNALILYGADGLTKDLENYVASVLL